jgi:hypothetical protein
MNKYEYNYNSPDGPKWGIIEADNLLLATRRVWARMASDGCHLNDYADIHLTELKKKDEPKMPRRFIDLNSAAYGFFLTLMAIIFTVMLIILALQRHAST